MPLLARVPPGVQTFFDDAVRRRKDVETAVLAVFSGWSYDEIWLPVFDYLDLFARGMGAWIPERTYRFTDRDGHLLALRPDFTSLVARTVATRFGGRPRPVRLCYSGEVFRYDEPRHGRRNEFHQIGIEHIGHAGLAADLEVLLVAREAMAAVGLDAPVLTLSHAGYHRALLQASAVDAEDARALRELWQRRSDEDLRRHLAGLGFAGDHPLAAVPGLVGAGALREARASLSTGGAGGAALAAVADLETLAEAGRQLGLGDCIQIDLGDASALDYYTGMTFRAFGPCSASEVGSGGRYDDLLGALGTREPAVGMVLYLERLLEASAARTAPLPEVTEIRAGQDLAGGFADAIAARGQGRQVRVVGP
ncbi:MAG: ATP phosphoribosyltransferase regulatory subunit [Candidatus Sericytochromatia bacterium]|uniref:ATP phosphoribosyltransferase regulatory subunit n=1 Tax=Candidatus Tanganyikabacteria bacterium TaxID=2961651 RepID=A0A938BM72_9BACT|nr:ATP phosphoribosyltransferase regulatory subunit [Candidatus Tanganyikabacteria bacterium]